VPAAVQCFSGGACCLGASVVTLLCCIRHKQNSFQSAFKLSFNGNKVVLHMQSIRCVCLCMPEACNGWIVSVPAYMYRGARRDGCTCRVVHQQLWCLVVAGLI
jgi:hypothetical protein